MGAFLAELSVQMKAIWARLDPGERLTVASVLLATLVGLGAIIWYASRPDYVPVFTAESGESLQEAEDALKQEGIAYVPEGSHTLKVDRDQYERASSVLYKEGITSAPGPSVTDSLTGLIPDRATRLYLLSEQRRGTAEAAVRALDDVLEVTVTASKPKQSPFRADDIQNRPSATASIRIRYGADFLKVAPHVADVVASATGIPKQFVQVRDARTHRTWVYNPDTGGTDMNDFMALQKSMSDSLTRKAQAALDVVYPGKTLVMVNVELDNNWERRREILRPSEPIVITDRSSSDSSTNGLQGGGDPSLSPGSATGSLARANTSSSKSETRDRSFATENGEREIGKLAPDINRITSAVFIDVSLSAEQSTIVAVLEPIIGRDETRGDPPTIPLVTEFPVSEPLEIAAGPNIMSAPGIVDFLRDWGPTIGQVIGVLLVLMFLRGLLKRAAQAGRQARTSIAEESEKEAGPEEATRKVRAEIEKAIAEDPAAISRLLESWLAEQKA